MRTIVGVMGGGCADERIEQLAYRTGQLIAENGWALLTGGRDAGVMAAASHGAAAAGGLVIGILPGADLDGVAPHVDIAIPTGMGDARNVINVLASRVVIALPGGAGTLSEVALALKSGRTVVTLDFPLGAEFEAYRRQNRLRHVGTAVEAVAVVREILTEEDGRS